MPLHRNMMIKKTSVFFGKYQSKINNSKRSISQELFTEEIGDKAKIILNRPKALNTLTTTHNIILYNTLQKCTGKSLIILKGTGSRSFCAGGDLLQTIEKIQKKEKDYVRDYMIYLNASIYEMYRFKAPIVAFMDGLTIGSGVGISIFAKYRIATENTRFMMPETKIGLHANAGATYFFNRSEGKLGYYLGLTGQHLDGTDVVRGKYATHYCLSKNIKKLEDELLDSSNEQDIKYIIDTICEKDLPEFSLNCRIKDINNCFSASTVEGVVLKLQSNGSNWAENTLGLLKRCSPTSLKVTLKQFQRGKNMNLLESLEMERILTVNLYDYPDIFEGNHQNSLTIARLLNCWKTDLKVANYSNIPGRLIGTRTTLKDKGDCPKWTPSNLADVTEDLVESFFKPASFSNRSYVKSKEARVPITSYAPLY